MPESVDQIQTFNCTIPNTATPSAPVSVPMQLGIWDIAWVEVDVPSGQNNATGFYIATSGQQYIPFRVGATPNWLNLSGSTKHWDLHNQPTSGDWSLVGYNLGNFSHTITVSWGLVLISNVTPSVTPQPLALSTLTGST